ncbi:SusC/RagA family TonB-linked outer membrane protein [Chitinophaga filiformis]|uniref:TonB-linked outer membrane protein, SusC/RagA family n=1 Tax=Chitinophaga filiformis TaxID=104663 RepID=A0A1G7LPC2_CHIFI|nr:SusC/RagA family TonB-linked outer membrane protein [Chitinophaga filiformis]SDF50799.1 TonB-linked outer membrane protein, SusC/RagA family [Chitinophaga filiformis]
MRLSTMLLLVCILQASAKTSHSQSITYTCKDAPLEQVFKVIKQQTGYVVFYDQELLVKTKRVTLTVKNLELESFLRKALDDQPLDYSIENKTIIISRKILPDKVPYVLPMKIPAVSGIITDEKGRPVARAVVRLLPTEDRGTLSEEDGSFIMAAVPPGNYTLEVRHLSFLPAQKRIVVTDKDVKVTISLTPQQRELKGVVISTGFQKIEKSATTGAYSLITARELEETPDINIMKRLEGKVPGVRFDIRNNRIQIRGVNNFGNSPPLIIIDGFPAIDQNLALRPGYTPLLGDQAGTSYDVLNAFNPADIESITFLKDAAATSIWGSSAANGVIVVETKKGRKGDMTTLSLGGTISIAAPANMKNMNAMNSREYIDFEKEMFDANFYQDPFTHWRYTNPSEAVRYMFLGKRGDITPQQRDEALEKLANTNNQSQLREYLLRQAVTQQYNMSVTGGGKNTSYYMSGNYSKNLPVFKGNQNSAYFVNSNFTTDLLDGRVKLSTGINYTHSNSVVNTAALNALNPGGFGLRPYDLVVDEHGQPKNYSIMFKPEVADSLRGLGLLPWTYSPVEQLNYSNNRFLKQTTRIQASLTTRLTSWADLQVSGMYQRSSQEIELIDELNSYATRDLLNTATSIQNGKLVYGIPIGDIVRHTNTWSSDYGVRGQLNIDKHWKGIHHINFLAGADIRETKSKGYRQTQYGYDPNTGSAQAWNPTVPYRTFFFGTRTLGYADGALMSDIKRYLSYFSNGNYSLYEKYFLSGSVRFDDFSMLGIERRNRAIPLWSAGLKWDIGRENFMPAKKWLTGLALRLTYGTAGTAPASGSNYPVVNIMPADPMTGLAYSSIGTPGNQDLGWETTATLNGGIDADILYGLLNITFDIYRKRSSGILAALPYNATYGWTSLLYNTASMNSHGFEFGINANIIRTKSWGYSTSFNLAYNTNKVTDTRFGVNTGTLESGSPVAGRPVDYLTALRWAGLDQEGQSLIYNSADKILTSTDGEIVKPEDRVYKGRSTPPVFGGFMHLIRYKQLSFSARMVFYMGHNIMKQDVVPGLYPEGGNAPGFLGTSKALVRRWRKPGDEAYTNIPGVIHSNFTSLSRYADADINVISASHARLEQISLNYMAGSRIIGNWPFIRSLTMGATVSNLGVIWRKNKDGIDPMYLLENNFGSMKPSPTYTFNFVVSF